MAPCYISVNTQVQTLHLLTKDDKTVARLVFEESTYADAQRERQGTLASRLRLLPVKGYDSEQVQAALMLKRYLGLEPVRTPLVLEALAAAGRRPGDYSSKLDYQLDPDQRADEAAKEIQLGLLHTIEANVPGTKANLDPEFLHDLRVAVRRARSALTQIKGVLDSRRLKHQGGARGRSECRLPRRAAKVWRYTCSILHGLTK